MWNKTKEQIAEQKEKIEGLKKKRDDLKEELVDLRLEKKKTDEDIKHMIKMSEERQALKMEKYKIQCDKEKETDIAEVKDAYRDKLEKRLIEEGNNIKVMYGQILERLPNIAVKLKGDA